MNEHINALTALNNDIEAIIKINYKTLDYKNIFGRIDIDLNYNDICDFMNNNSEYIEIKNNLLVKAIKINKYYAYLYIFKNHTSTKIKSDKDFKDYIKQYNSRKIGIMYFHVLNDKKAFINLLDNFDNVYKVNKSDYYIVFSNISKTDFYKKFNSIKTKINKNKLMIGATSMWQNKCDNLRELISKIKR